jgi:hypothetical protein
LLLNTAAWLAEVRDRPGRAGTPLQADLEETVPRLARWFLRQGRAWQHRWEAQP